MQVHGIISNTVTEEIRLKGHQSIRFSPDGFSVLVSDASYRPVFLSQYDYKDSVPANLLPQECKRILSELELLTLEGETVFIVDSQAVTLVPEEFSDETRAGELLRNAATLTENNRIYSRMLKSRPQSILYAVDEEIETLKSSFQEKVKVLHTMECLISLSDQVRASDHQRGVIMAEIQPHTLDILVIIEDRIRLTNHYPLKDPSDFIYHTMNTIRQLELDREKVPVYLSGMIHEDHELYGLLGKYVRNVNTTPYYLEELSKTEMLRYMILSEGSKCA